MVAEGLVLWVARRITAWYKRRAASARARTNWVRLVRKFRRVRRLQRFFHVGVHLRGYI